MNDRPEVLMPNMNVYAFCAYALFHLKGRHRMVVYDKNATIDNITDAVIEWYQLEGSLLNQFKEWLTENLVLQLYINNYDKLLNAVTVEEGECLSFLYLSSHGDENGHMVMPGGETLSNELDNGKLRTLGESIGFESISGTYSLSEDFQLMLNGCFLGRYTAHTLSYYTAHSTGKMRIVLGCTECIPTNGVYHYFKVCENRLYFYAKVLVSGENRLYAFYDDVVTKLDFETYTPTVDTVKNYDGDVITNVFVPDATTIQTREFAGAYLGRIVAPSVKTVESEAFTDSQLRAVVMPNVTTIKEGAFLMCDRLSYIYTPNLEIIDSEAFELEGNTVKMVAPKLREKPNAVQIIRRSARKRRRTKLVDSFIKLRF